MLKSSWLPWLILSHDRMDKMTNRNAKKQDTKCQKVRQWWKATRKVSNLMSHVTITSRTLAPRLSDVCEKNVFRFFRTSASGKQHLMELFMSQRQPAVRYSAGPSSMISPERSLSYLQDLVILLVHPLWFPQIGAPVHLQDPVIVQVILYDFPWKKPQSICVYSSRFTLWGTSVVPVLREQSGPQPELDIKFPVISFANRLNQNIGLTAKGLSSK